MKEVAERILELEDIRIQSPDESLRTLACYEMFQKAPTIAKAWLSQQSEIALLRSQIKTLLSVLSYSAFSCESLHHTKADRHDYLEQCPVVLKVGEILRALDTDKKEGE